MIELLIEGIRGELFQKLTREVPPDQFNFSSLGDVPFNSSPGSSEQMIIDSFNAEYDSQDENHNTLSEEAAFSSQSVPMEYDHNPDSQFPASFAQGMEGSPYLVTDSVFLSDKSERVFKVVTGSSEHYYYAFKLGNYIVCPAFLAGLFNLTDFVCLDVRNSFNFYYIFLTKEFDDPASHIFGVDADFRSEYLFATPREDKIFHLSLENKDCRCFFGGKDFVRKHDLDAFDDYEAFIKSNSNQMKRSVQEPDYLFVPEVLKGDFKRKYEELFAPSFEFKVTALVYKECFSFFEILRFSEPIKSEEGKKLTETLGQIFNITRYEREEYILEKLVEHIRVNFKEGSQKKVTSFYASMIAVLQSTGYGKSRLMEKLGCKTPTFYSSLQKGSGFPLKTFFMSRFIEELDRVVPKGVPCKDATEKNYCYINNVATAIYIYILRILYIILKKNENLELKENLEIDIEIENHHFFNNIKNVGESTKVERIFKILFRDLEIICRSDVNIEFDGSHTLKLEDIPKIGPDLNVFNLPNHKVNKLEDDVVLLLQKLKEKNVVNTLPAIFVIDEAHGLKCKNLKSRKQDFGWKFRNIFEKELLFLYDRSPYNPFRRAFRIYTNAWEQIILIIVSTSGQISVLIPELVDDPSRRPEGSHRYMENFAFMYTYNANSEIAPFINAEMFQIGKYKDIEGIDGWRVFLKSKFRISEYFKFGRPLIYGIFKLYSDGELANDQYDLEKDFEFCAEFRFLADKLFGGKAYNFTTDMGLLYSMFNFAFGTNFLPSFLKKEDLVKSYLMTLVKYTDELEKGIGYATGGFLPEGIFNFLSAKYLIGFTASLSDVLFSSVKYGLCHLGNFGELLAQSILLKTIFDIIDFELKKVRKLVFEPVYLENFLLSLCGEMYESSVNDFFACNKSLIKSQISFGYFEHFPRKDVYLPFDLMARSLFKGSAVTLNNLFRGIDLMIPLVLDDGRISFLGIQVKFGKEKYVDQTVNRALKKLTFSNMFKSLQDDPQGPQTDRPFGLVILALGNYSSLKVYVANEENTSSSQSPKNDPPVLVIKGIPRSTGQLVSLFNLAPTDFSYRGINADYLEECDRLYELTQEIIPQQRSEKPEYIEQEPKLQRPSTIYLSAPRPSEEDPVKKGQCFDKPFFDV